MTKPKPIDPSKPQKINVKDLAVQLGTAPKTIYEWMAIGMPYHPKEPVIIENLCQWVLASDEVTMESKAKITGYMQVQASKTKLKENSPQKPKEEPAPNNEPTKIFDSALEENLNNLREASLDAYKRYKASLNPQCEEDMIVAPPMALKIWNDVSEVLRKSEMDCFKMLEQKKLLVPIDEVRQIVNSVFSGLVKTLLTIPQKIAPSLDGEEWTTIQTVMQKELIETVNDFRKRLSDYKLD